MGNIEAIRLDRTLLRQLGVTDGDEMSVEVHSHGSMVLRPKVKPIVAHNLKELFDGYRGDYYGEEFASGKPAGSELF